MRGPLRRPRLGERRELLGDGAHFRELGLDACGLGFRRVGALGREVRGRLGVRRAALGVAGGFERLHYQLETAWEGEGDDKRLSYAFLKAADDAHAFDTIPLARKELHRLLEDRELATTPLLVLANKIDLEPHISEAELIRELNLDYIVDNPWIVIPISALRVINIDQVVQWLIKQGKTNR